MSANFWDVKTPDDEEKPVQQNEVEPVEKQNNKQADQIQFHNPLKIQVDGKTIQTNVGREVTTSLLDNIRKKYNANTIGFFISERTGHPNLIHL